ncbi:glycosyltransferase family 87 protein [Paraliomyxa miuraensis]|uniref:glycosyltransferase family 87 protein n=1 Tax=Paraliomyxa miuraensis TaxID=376150 RepID=UPI002253DA4B|nr:glycosyltransferase family 87 protein [Paraliomyxa miuraensis]MCX4246109.1 DUF2029 domain-containing protein [Paraliomyxa miuraensis]
MPAPIRRNLERWLFTGLVALLLAPVIAQGLDRPLASLFASRPSGSVLTVCSLVIALTGWLVVAMREHARPYPAWGATGLVGVVLVLALGLGMSGASALVAVTGATVMLSRWLPARLPAALDGIASRRRVLTIAYVVMALISVVQVARVSVFIADPTRTDAQVVPGLEFLERHSCLTAYVRASEMARDGVDDLYRAERWPIDLEAEARPQTPFSPFDIDPFFYPPPFLLVAELLAPMRGDFLAQRAAWFGLNGLLVALALGLAARSFGGARWHRALLFAPLFFASLPVLVLLQVGNAQAAVVVAAVLAMLAFEVDRPALGGFALALATMAKISPGILGVILLVRGRWRAVAWTAGFGALMLVATLLVYGLDPLESWVSYALPRLSSGEAFSVMLRHPESIAVNQSPSGVAFKLGLIGIDVGDPWPLARWINRVVTIVVVVLAVVIGRRQRAPVEGTLTSRALAWMALLFLTALRSPFAPGYVIFALAWAITLLTTEVRTMRGGLALLALWAVVTLLPPLSPEALAVYFTLPQVAAIAVSLWLILRGSPALPAS